MKNFITIVLVLFSGCVFAQTQYEHYDWNTIPPKFPTDTIKAVDGAVVLLERRIAEVYENKNGYFEEISVLHRKVKLETDKAINEHNKIYIPIRNVLEILKMEARFITPSGTVVNVSKENMKEVENLENQGNFKIFAIEGAEAGGIMEYYYILRKQYTPYGTLYLQETSPKGDVTVLFSYPSGLTYQFKSYNGFPEFKPAETENDKSLYMASAGYIPALQSERYAYYKSNLMRYEFTLSYNRYKSNLRLYSWNKASNNIYQNVYLLKKNEQNAVESWIRKMNIPQSDLTTRVRFIENLVKSTISISEAPEGNPDLADIIKLKKCEKGDLVKLLIAIFNTEKINFELVLTSDKEVHKFDADFNGFNFLDEYLIYFPENKLFLDPSDPDYRLGTIPDVFQGEFGLFLHPVASSEGEGTLSYQIRMIPVVSCFVNTDSLLVTADLDPDQTSLRINSKRIWTGDVARNFQCFWDMVNQEKKDELVKIVFNMGGNAVNVEKCNVANSAPENIGKNPFIWDIDLKAGSLVETAGSDIIVKIGNVIGTQSELYQTTPRQLPVDIDVLRSYYRRIIFNIPAGYKVSNPDNLKMRVEMNNNGTASCLFTSDAIIENEQLIITSTEFYSEQSYPVNRYEEFRNVINAAADFNKKTIVLVKIP